MGRQNYGIAKPMTRCGGSCDLDASNISKFLGSCPMQQRLVPPRQDPWVASEFSAFVMLLQNQRRLEHE